MQYRNAVNALLRHVPQSVVAKQMTPEQLRAESIELLSSAIAGSSGNLSIMVRLSRLKSNGLNF